METTRYNYEAQEPDEVAERLSGFAIEEVLPSQKHPPQTLMTTFIGEWYPTWKENPKDAFRFLRAVLAETSTDFQKETGRKPIFLDLGSGDGMIPACATTTGEFSRCYGVEFRGQLNGWAQANMKNLEDSKIIPKGSVKLITGSYYTEKHWPLIRDKYIERQTALGTPEWEIEYAVREADVAGHALDGELLDEEGKLKADIIYWFPSDSFLPDSLEQWKEIIRSGTILVLHPSGQVIDMERIGFFDNFEHVKDYHLEGAEENVFSELNVYRKK